MSKYLNAFHLPWRWMIIILAAMIKGNNNNNYNKVRIELWYICYITWACIVRYHLIYILRIQLRDHGENCMGARARAYTHTSYSKARTDMILRPELLKLMVKSVLPLTSHDQWLRSIRFLFNLGFNSSPVVPEELTLFAVRIQEPLKFHLYVRLCNLWKIYFVLKGISPSNHPRSVHGYYFVCHK